MNKIIAFANQKGGCGKSTLCLLFANYLASRKKSACVVDIDTQQSLVLQRKDDVEFLDDTDMPYSIQGYDEVSVEGMQQLMQNARAFDGYVLIDCPGNMRDDNLIPVLTQADFIICPFRYDSKTLTSTGTFVTALRNLWDTLGTKHVSVLFVPNNIVRKGNLSEKQMWREVAKTFGMLGTLLDAVPGRAALERVNTYEITTAQREIVRVLFDKIIEITK